MSRRDRDLIGAINVLEKKLETSYAVTASWEKEARRLLGLLDEIKAWASKQSVYDSDFDDLEAILSRRNP